MNDANYLLALDIGANSIGWACMTCDDTGEPTGFVDGQAVGAHVFDAGVENFFGSGQGKEESRGAKRRAARMMRRQLQRRARRVAHTYNILAGAGLLPALNVPPPRDPASADQREFEAAQAKARDEAIKALDAQIAAQYESRLATEALPYFLRARALDHKLSAYEVGRALFHLAQRRGFKSARKGGSKESDEERSTVLSHINGIWAELGRDRLGHVVDGATPQARTLGELFLKRAEGGQEVRGNWTHRRMYQQEFAAIWDAQAKHHPELLTEELRARLAGPKGDGGAIFYQRPLKLQEHLIGVCDIYDGVRRKPAERRAPWACMEAQRFRMIQKVNDLRIIEGDHERALTDDERAKLLDVLSINAKVTLKRPKKTAEAISVPVLLNLPKSAKFNFGRDDADNDDLPDFLPGNRTAAALVEIFGENKWRKFTPEQQSEIADACWDAVTPGALAEMAIAKWGATPEQAERLEEELALEDGYCNLSCRALRELLPLMEKRTPYMTARLEVFGPDPRPPKRDLLPPVKDHLPTLRNPVVHRALTELRRVVNAIVRRHGKPFMIRIELAREMKKSAKQREAILIANKKREKERRKAAERIVEKRLTDAKNPDDVKPWDIEKVLLFDECGGICPYTGRQIDFRDLFSGGVDVEHIIPYSRSLDNSFQNKTLCLAEENRNVKKRQTPWQAYAHTARWQEILDRVERMKNPAKLERFQLDDNGLEKFLNDFTSAQLVNTAYASRLALDYLGTLYGLPPGKSHVADESGRQKIQVCNGRLTSLFRAAWGLNAILNDGDEKKRNDHRHHAVDAVCIGVTTVRNRQMMERQVMEFERRQPVGSNKKFSLRKGDVPPPFDTFFDGTRQRIESCNVSRRVDKSVHGALHAETNFSPRFNENGQRDPEGAYSHIRRFVHTLSADAINSEDTYDKKGRLKDKAVIVDPVVRKAVQAKLAEVGGDPKKLEENPPVMPSGRPIYRARVRKKNKTMPLGEGIRQRHVESGSNHHVEIIQTMDKKGNPKWDMRFVTMMEAYRRKNARLPVVDRTVGPDEEFICSLVGGDAFIWEAVEGKPELFRVRTLDAGNVRIAFVRATDARKKKEILDAGDFIEKSAEMLRKGQFQKIIVTPLGEVRPVND
ncbi:MAG: type II CRISPR RNA-guided endonuclease Cas9 [Planctomycetes bacterium]|nr:type II CRISPR RNA-guided endonuclease Cas9 [Planctomycetota bacterium]